MVVMLELAARVMTEASMGPTQGVQTRPRLRPIRIPPQKPCLVPELAGVRRLVNDSQRCLREGTTKRRPNRRSTITARLRRESGLMPVALTRVVRVRVNTVKLPTKPVTTPMGRYRFFVAEPARMMGRRGRMQGERIVTKPAKKAKRMSKSILMKIG